MTWHRPPVPVQPHSDGDALLPRRVAAYLAGVDVNRVRRHCRPVACDVRTRTVMVALSDVEALASDETL